LRFLRKAHQFSIDLSVHPHEQHNRIQWKSVQRNSPMKTYDLRKTLECWIDATKATAEEFWYVLIISMSDWPSVNHSLCQQIPFRYWGDSDREWTTTSGLFCSMHLRQRRRLSDQLCTNEASLMFSAHFERLFTQFSVAMNLLISGVAWWNG
jgi:hypothetical protein